MKLPKPIIYKELCSSSSYRDKSELEREKTALNSNLESYVHSITSPTRERDTFICPLCGSGKKKNGTAAFKLYEEDGAKKWKCFSCTKGGDIFDLIGEYEGKREFSEQIQRARELFPNSANPLYTYRGDNNKTVAPHDKNSTTREEQQPKKLVNYTPLYEEWNRALNENFSSYRGISLETLNKLNIGYCKEWRHPKAPNSPATEVIILPINRESYTARALDPDTPHGERYKQVAGEGRHFFNELALSRATQPIWITEGEIDALSVIEAGGEAIALSSLSNIKSFIKHLENNRPTQPLIIALDNDEKGEAGKVELKAGLEGLNITFTALSLPLIGKDPNDILQSGRDTLERLIADNRDTARKEYVNSQSIKGFMSTYRYELSSDDYGRAYSTGFSLLDEILNGGLREGLTVIGALSGTGKTTLLLQIANNIAEQGEDVIYFSLEMNKSELLTKTISRFSYQIPKSRGESATYSKTLISLYKGKGKWNTSERTLICESLDRLESYSEHLYIVDGIGQITLEVIQKTVEKHIEATGRKPLVFVDYLQIIVPEDNRSSDKTNTDIAVVGLKKLSSAYHIPVISLSSFNRDSYKVSCSQGSFKESGGIEYSADILFGLEFSNTGAANYLYSIERKKDDPFLTLKPLKYRQGSTKYGVKFVFHKKFNCFEEIEKVEPSDEELQQVEKQRAKNSKK